MVLGLIKGWVVGYGPHVSIHNGNLDLQLRETVNSKENKLVEGSQ